MEDDHLSMSNRDDGVDISLNESINTSDEINKLPDDPEELIKMLEKVSTRYELVEHENALLTEKYSSVSQQLAAQKENSKQQIMQAETMGMMTKYQLVFVKMETAFSKIFNHNKLRDLNRMQDAFTKFKFNTLKNRIEINCGSKIALENIKSALKFTKIYQKFKAKSVRDAFQAWKGKITIEKSLKKRKKDLDFELNNANEEKKRIERRIHELEEEIEENDKRYNHLYALVKDNTKKISLIENNVRELSNDINQMDNEGNARVDLGNRSPSQDKIRSLQARLTAAMNENKDLNFQMETTNKNVKSFISEMSTLMSSHELGQMLDPLAEIGEQMFEDQLRNSKRRVQQTN